MSSDEEGALSGTGLSGTGFGSVIPTPELRSLITSTQPAGGSRDDYLSIKDIPFELDELSDHIALGYSAMKVAMQAEFLERDREMRKVCKERSDLENEMVEKNDICEQNLHSLAEAEQKRIELVARVAELQKYEFEKEQYKAENDVMKGVL